MKKKYLLSLMMGIASSQMQCHPSWIAPSIKVCLAAWLFKRSYHSYKYRRIFQSNYLDGVPARANTLYAHPSTQVIASLRTGNNAYDATVQKYTKNYILWAICGVGLISHTFYKHFQS